MKKLKILIVLYFTILDFVTADPIVNLPKGKIRGKFLTSPNGRSFYGFLGIPFAKPPLGALRFKAPVEPDSWNGIKNTTQDSNICYSSKYDMSTESEDCLYINVLTPALRLNETKLPVLFSIYGGAFRSGYGGYGNGGPDWFVEEDIVFVNFNYRLGPFGFLSTGDLVAPGNSGLKDQHLALKWTYENIDLFGGDPKKITIQGQSAGGASVTFQILNKKNKGLFRAGIAESGSVFSGWAHLGDSKSYAINLITTMNNGTGPSDNSSQSILDYLLEADAKAIDLASENMGSALALPTIEPEHDGAFITESQYTLLQAGEINKVPLLIGINSEEDISRANDLNSLENSAAQYDRNPSLLVPGSMGALANENRKLAGQAIREAYVGNGRFSDDLGPLVSYFSDTSFTRPTIRYAELQSQFTPVYFYQFSYKGKMGMQANAEIEGAETVAHGEEVHYYMVTKNKNMDNTQYDQFPEDDVLTHFRFVELWSNFVKYLNPTPTATPLLFNLTWPVVTPNNFLYLNINATLEIRNNPKSPRYEAWKVIFEKYGVEPFVTY